MVRRCGAHAFMRGRPLAKLCRGVPSTVATWRWTVTWPRSPRPLARISRPTVALRSCLRGSPSSSEAASGWWLWRARCVLRASTVFSLATLPSQSLLPSDQKRRACRRLPSLGGRPPQTVGSSTLPTRIPCPVAVIALGAPRRDRAPGRTEGGSRS